MPNMVKLVENNQIFNPINVSGLMLKKNIVTIPTL